MGIYLTLNDVVLRLFLAAVLGGIIGLERENKRKSVGFTTHILVCLGASVTTLTSQYLVLNMNYYADITRLGAQVIAGIGFIGTGTIIVSKGQRIKGLTTAAGLWVCAVIGLSTGAGLYDIALTAVFLIMIIELPFAKIEHRFLHKSQEINILVEYTDKESFIGVSDIYRSLGIRIYYIKFLDKSADESSHRVIFFLHLNNKTTPDKLIELLTEQNNVVRAKIISENEYGYNGKHISIT